MAVAVIQVFAVYRAAEFGGGHGAVDLGGGGEVAFDDLSDRHHAFEGVQLVGFYADAAADGGGGDFAAAEGLHDVVVAGYFSVARAGGNPVVDAASVQRGVQDEILQSERLFARGGQGDVAALLAQVEVAAWALGVAQIPVGGDDEVVLHGGGVEVVELFQMQVVGAAFADQSCLFAPSELFEPQAAA